jgi:hypothetical protein
MSTEPGCLSWKPFNLKWSIPSLNLCYISFGSLNDKLIWAHSFAYRSCTVTLGIGLPPAREASCSILHDCNGSGLPMDVQWDCTGYMQDFYFREAGRDPVLAVAYFCI